MTFNPLIKNKRYDLNRRIGVLCVGFMIIAIIIIIIIYSKHIFFAMAYFYNLLAVTDLFTFRSMMAIVFRSEHLFIFIIVQNIIVLSDIVQFNCISFHY